MRPRYKYAVTIMTALVPTVGHAALVDFVQASAWHSSYVIVSHHDREPTSVYDRIAALKFGSESTNQVFIRHDANYIQREPNGTPEFWHAWAKEIYKRLPADAAADHNTVLVGSENYCVPLSVAMNCEFMQFDIKRQVCPISGTEVRKDLIGHYDKLTPWFQKLLTFRVVLFGAESTGKTTMARALARSMNGHFVPEWAREYLEREDVGRDITFDKMRAIADGQLALERMSMNLTGKPFAFYDTDIISTHGYYPLMGYRADESPFHNETITPIGDLYLVMNSDIPFEADPLRYGGDVRQASDEYWIDFLTSVPTSRRIEWIRVPNGSHAEQEQFCRENVMQRWNRKFSEIINYKRD